MLLIKLLSRLPMGVLYFITDCIYVLIYHVIGYRKNVVLTNLRNSFPAKSDIEIKKIAQQFYVRFSEYMAETIKAVSISEEEIRRRVKFVNVSAVEEYASRGQSIILTGSHQFNWEWALLAGCLYLPYKVDAVYQRLSNKKFDKLMFDTRAKFGGQPIHKKYVLRTLLKTRTRLRALAILADQSPSQKIVKYWTTFMNQETAFFLGPEQIAKAMNYPVFFFKMVRIRRGYYTVELVKLTDPPYEKDSHKILDLYIEQAQKLIEEDPAGYLWSHNRWKLKKEGGDILS